MSCPSIVTVGDSMTFTVLTMNSSRELTDADAVPAYRIYEAETATPIATGNMAKLDDANTTGFYSEKIDCTVANGYEASKSYNIYIPYTVSGSGSGSGELQSFRVINDNPAGPGDYEVTLTIRTTGGSALSGVSVWLNTDNDRSAAVAGTNTTNDSGEVTFYLNYSTTYYIFCHLTGYSFASANMTPESGTVTFTKDIATAVTVAAGGASTNYADSFLTRAIARVRKHTDEPSINKKYSDDEIIEQLEQSYLLIINEKNRNATTPIVASVDITTAGGTTQYVLPHTVGSIIAVYEATGYGTKLYYNSRSDYNSLGKRLWIEGNILNLQADGLIGNGKTLTVEYLPAGIARLHNGTLTLNAAGTVATLGSTPNVGTLDTHDEGYTGCVLRILGVNGTTTTGDYLQERTITAYDNTTRAATIAPALSPIPTTDDGYIFYEIAPSIHKGMDAVVPLHTAWTIAAIEGDKTRASLILKTYQEAIRNVRLTAYYSHAGEASTVRGDNFDNRRY